MFAFGGMHFGNTRVTMNRLYQDVNFILYVRELYEKHSLLTYNLSTNTEFALSSRKITENLDRTGRQQHRIIVGMYVCMYVCKKVKVKSSHYRPELA
jgi:hypothetical protein